MAGIIFDLDQTLVDSKFVEPYRNSRNWSKVKELINYIKPYEGIDSIIRNLLLNKIPISIVTNAPSFYVNQILRKLNWKIKYKVCYHDVPKGFQKPHSLPILQAIQEIGIQKSEFICSFGDRDIDIIASKNANVYSIGCLWGSDKPNSLINVNPDLILKTVAELKSFIESKFLDSF